MKHNFLYLLSILTLTTILMTNACAQKKQDLLFLLSDRHQVPSLEVLEGKYESTDQLISDLLELRLTENPPFVSLRAEELLLEYSDREDVLLHLEEDLSHPERKGLARVIIRGLHKIRDEEAKTRFSRTSAELVRSVPFFSPMKEFMIESPDPVVKRAIAEAS